MFFIELFLIFLQFTFKDVFSHKKKKTNTYKLSQICRPPTALLRNDLDHLDQSAE